MTSSGVRVLMACAATLVAACASTAPRTSMPELSMAAAAPARTPETGAVTPKLVTYPGLGVSYVENGEGDVYFCNDRFWCYFDSGWFHAEAIDGPWEFVEMKYVPGDLFRVKGHLPPTLEQKRRS